MTSLSLNCDGHGKNLTHDGFKSVSVITNKAKCIKCTFKDASLWLLTVCWKFLEVLVKE